jgi:hypothetical protein
MPHHTKEQYFDKCRKPKKSVALGQWQKVCFWRKRAQPSNKLQDHPACHQEQRPNGPDRRTAAYKHQQAHQQQHLNQEDNEQQQQQADAGDNFDGHHGHQQEQHIEQVNPMIIQNQQQKRRKNPTSTSNPLIRTRSGNAGRVRFSQRNIGGSGFIDHELGDLILHGGR